MKEVDWGAVATHLQDAGYFTRYCHSGNEEWLDVCKPDNDVFDHELKKDLRGIDVKVTQLPNHEPEDLIICRIEAMKECSHLHATVRWELYAIATLEEPEERIGQATCDDCGETMDPEDLPEECEREDINV